MVREVLCPECDCKTTVVDSVEYAGAVYRRRKCKICGFSFHTEETEITDDEQIIRDAQAYKKWKYSTNGDRMKGVDSDEKDGGKG